ncbi:MAG: alpha/beta hydrolase [Burkholderiales bacterium]|nr:alpha/beta hydrolase [Burkholderiales bacterium]
MPAIVHTPESVEHGYNNRAAVPEHPQWFARYAQWSAAAVERYRPARNLRYGPGPKETLDLYLPAGRVRGVFAFLHGGYWRSLDKDDFSFVAGAFVEQGIAVANVNYDLCPVVSIPAIVDECRRAMIFLAREGAAHGAPADHLVVGGHSAGGHLAAMMYTTDWTAQGLDAAPLRAGVTLSGVHDLEPMVLFSFNADFRLDAPEAMRMSPTHHPLRARVPLLMACGADETSEFLRQTQLLWDAWPEVRRPWSAPLFVPGADHFSVVAGYADPDSALTQATLGLF